MGRLRVGMIILIVGLITSDLMVTSKAEGGQRHERRAVVVTATYTTGDDLRDLVHRTQERASRSEQRHALKLRRIAAKKARAAQRQRVHAAVRRDVSTSAPIVAGWQAWAASSRVVALRTCESGGNYSTNTGNGYSGAYQFSTSTWQANGGSGEPWQNPPAVQDQIAYRLYLSAGSSPWPICGRYL